MALNFIISANVTLFAGQFVGESDFARRGQLKQLLIEEENKFGLLTEKLEQVLRRLGESSARIASVETILERSRSNGHETGPTDHWYNRGECRTIIDRHTNRWGDTVTERRRICD
jgi:hypothetical protein